MKESDIEKYLVERVKALGGECRKVKWIGRKSAPDRLVMLPFTSAPKSSTLDHDRTIWIELKRTGKLATFPADAHERAQAREHKRMCTMGQRVVVIDSFAGVDEVLR